MLNDNFYHLSHFCQGKRCQLNENSGVHNIPVQYVEFSDFYIPYVDTNYVKCLYVVPFLS